LGVDEVRHLRDGVHVGHLDVALCVRVRVGRVVDELARGLVLGDARDLDAPGRRVGAGAHGGRELRAEAARGDLLQHDLLAAVRLAVRALRGLGVGEVLRRDVHPQALRGERRRRDVEAAEEAHDEIPMAERRIAMRVCSTDTAVSWSRVFWTSLADSASMSMPEPSAATGPTVLSAVVWKLESCSALSGSVDPMATASWSWKSTSTRW